MQCPNCNFENPEGFSFCGNCGQRLTQTDEDATASSLKTLRMQMPESFAAKVRAATDEPAGESRIITALFADVVGSTRLAAHLEPEVWLNIVREAHTRMSRAIYKYEGYVAQLLGDGLLAYFGAPVAHEDDPERAVRSALHLQKEIGRYAAELAAHQGVDLSVRVAVNTGPVVISAVGAAPHVEYLAVGDTVNIAARAQSNAKPGTVVITPETYRLVSGVFESESLGLFEFKGADAPVELYKVTAPKAAARRRGLEGIEQPLIGREAEMLTLEWWADEWREGRGRIVTVVGMPGVGKSRLIEEVRRTLIAPETLWLEGRCLSFTGDIVYAPWLEIVHAFIGTRAGQPQEEIEAAVRATLEQYIPTEAEKYLPHFVTFATQDSVARAQRQYTQSATTVIGGPLFKGLRALFTAVAEQQPLVLVIDDMHWADLSSLQLTQYILPIVRKAPVLFFGIFRTGPEGEHHGLHRYLAQAFPQDLTEITLRDLLPEDARQLLNALLGERFVPTALKNQILDRAEGNPLFIEDSVKTLLDSGWLGTSGSDATGALATHRSALVPESIKSIAAARIDRLPDETRVVLQSAAIIGHKFPLDLLRQLAAVDDLRQHLDEFESLELAHKSMDTSGAPTFVFQNVAVREVAYQSMLPSRRRQLHARVAEMLDADPEVEPDSAALAYHCSSAGDLRRAKQYLERAAGQRDAGQLSLDSVRYIADALHNFEDVQDAALGLTPLQHAHWERRLADFYAGMHDYAGARALIEQALTRLGYSSDTRADSAWGTSLREATRLLGAVLLWPLRRKRSLADDPIVREVFWGLLRLGYLQYYQGARAATTATSMRFLALVARQPAMCIERARLNIELAVMFLVGGWTGPPVRYLLTNSTRYLEATSHETSMHVGRLIWGYYHSLKGDHEAAFGELDSALDYFSHHRGEFEWSLAFINTSRNFFNWGRLKRCEAYAREILAAGDESGSVYLAGWGRFILARVSERRGEVSRAIELASQARADFVASGETTGRFAAGGLLAYCWLQRGDYGRAIREAQETLAARARQRAEPWAILLPLGALTHGLLAARREGNLPGEAGLQRLQRAVRDWLTLTKQERLGAADALLARGAYEELLAKTRAARRSLGRALARAEALGQTYVAARARVALARLDGETATARPHLEQALATFEELGATRDLQLVRELLDTYPQV